MNRLRAGRVHAPGTEAVRSLNQGPLVSLSSLTATLQRLSSNCSPPFPEYLKSWQRLPSWTERLTVDIRTETGGLPRRIKNCPYCEIGLFEDVQTVAL